MRIVIIVLALLAGMASTFAGPHIVVDLETGRVLHQYRPLEPWYPASLTKLMTVYVTLEAIKSGEISLQSPVTISKNAMSEPPSKMGFKVGTVLTVDNALKMLVVKSANDIAVALAESVAGSEARFIAQMNQSARKLGMTGTQFRNPHGLPAQGQVTNARDMAVLTRALLKEYPAHSGLFKITAIRHGQRVLNSYNPLLQHYRGATGMKTGFICSSGFNLAASAKRENKHVVAVVLGAKSSVERAEKAARLLNRGFRGFQLIKGKTVDALQASGLGRAPKDMRAEICSKEARQARQEELKDYRMGEGKSVLSPNPLLIAKPIRVFTGGARKHVGVRFRQAPPPVSRPQRLADLNANEEPEIRPVNAAAAAASNISQGIPIPVARP